IHVIGGKVGSWGAWRGLIQRAPAGRTVPILDLSGGGSSRESGKSRFSPGADHGKPDRANQVRISHLSVGRKDTRAPAAVLRSQRRNSGEAAASTGARLDRQGSGFIDEANTGKDSSGESGFQISREPFLRRRSNLAMKSILGALCAFCLAVPGGSAKVVDRIVAQVNDDIITLSDLNRE